LKTAPSNPSPATADWAAPTWAVEQVREDFMKSVDYLRGLGFKPHHPENRLLRYGRAGHGHQVRHRCRFGSAHHRRIRRRHRHEPLEHDAELGRALHHPAFQSLRIRQHPGGQRDSRSWTCPLPAAFALEDSIFKGLALGAPFTKMICMGRAIMIPGFVGSNIEGALNYERRAAVNGHWNNCPKPFYRWDSAKEIFACYHDVEKIVGKDEMKNIPTAPSPSTPWRTNCTAVCSS
jgi:hypothetical protein